MKRVVITGMGVVSPVGNTVEDFWNSLKAGKHGFSYVNDVTGDDFDVKIAARVKEFTPDKYVEKKESRRMDRFTQFAVNASLDALADSGSDFKDLDPFRAGVIFGVGIGGLNLTLQEKFLEKGPDRISVFYVPMMIGNMAAGTISMRTGFKGDNFCSTTACASSAHAVGEAFRKIKDGYLDVCIAGGAESCVGTFALGGFNNMKALTRSDDLDRCSIPFDAERSGFVLGEGCGALVLEELEHAGARGMVNAFSEAGLKAEDIDYINAHGTSTGLNDKYETKAVKKALGEETAKKVVINSTKSMTGHLLGAAGAVEAIVTALSVQNDYVHQTIGYKVPDPECDLDYCTEGGRNMTVNAALSNSLGFGGHNATLCIIKYKE